MMQFSLPITLQILSNTSSVLESLVNNLSHDWLTTNSGNGTWTIKEVVAHLIVCEDTNWLPRIKTILNAPEISFDPIDMDAHFKIAQSCSLYDLLGQFSEKRTNGIEELRLLNLQEFDFVKTGVHPVIGKVSLSEVISTWGTHDLAHISQIVRIIAKQNRESVGGFKRYLKILDN